MCYLQTANAVVVAADAVVAVLFGAEDTFGCECFCQTDPLHRLAPNYFENRRVRCFPLRIGSTVTKEKQILVCLCCQARFQIKIAYLRFAGGCDNAVVLAFRPLERFLGAG